ncbi:50S ribosomal protein L11 methyltransferase [Helicobacter sp. MIT 05-5293]|uniref:50S ribosomal protein L11 methyltransferase n=1 Tax=Helicobacter sp. MIT 05-5293 TaxID=1548149 RepID=UPI00051DBAC6|nr:50S ribosomal protein L11 methyltransferase [Helicobacter sp. MIT 05-5293]TLD81632.1 50S ribosomal protein L11 methyltransferase [Helicobacter sp. MIT 05-5293]
MQGLEQQTYWEIIIYPNAFLDAFSNFLIDQTSCAIEYQDLSDQLSPFYISYEDTSWQSFHNFNITQAKQCPQTTQIILRIPSSVNDTDHSAYDPKIHALIESLQNFTSALNEYTATQKDDYPTKVDFCYHIVQKHNHDWLQIYQDSIKPIECPPFYICPSWASSSPSHLQQIIIDPALAFGSGHHASTLMCLEFLSAINLKNKNVLDVGCGSGILSIAASKLGAKVFACDTDELAIQETQKNAHNNHISLESLWLGSIQESPDTPSHYDVIVANIVAFVVKLLHNDFKAKLKKNGILILSGILDEYKSDIIATFNDFTLSEIHQKDEWIALKLISQNN